MRALFSRGLLIFLYLIIVNLLSADTRGKLSGYVKNSKTGEPIPSANVLLVGTTIGSACDLNGYYVILNIPPGIYDVRVSSVGYKTKIIKQVQISAGQTTTLDVSLDETFIELGEEVVVTAEKPIVDVRQTSSVTILNKEEITLLPIQEVNEIVNLQAGVIDGHFRGGRLGEVQYQVDGVSVNNPFSNASSLKLDRTVLEEVQVINGTFDAEYGQAMSGVVNAVLKSGSEGVFEWSSEVYTGDYFGPDVAKHYPFINKISPRTIQNYQLNLSGPTFLPKTFFVFNIRKYYNEGYLYGVRRFVPTDRSNFEKRIFVGSGDEKLVPMSPYEELSWMSKLTNKSIKNLQLAYQVIGNSIVQKTYNHAFRFNPDGIKTQRQFSIVHGIELTHTLSSRFFYTLSFRQNYFKYTDYVYEDVFDPRYLQAGKPIGDPNYEYGAVVQGVDLSRFLQKTNSLIIKWAMSAQVTNVHFVKLGAEFQTSEVSFGPPGVLIETTINGVQTLVPVVEHPNYPGVRTYHPKWLSAFIQDRVELSYLLLRFGVRLEYFDANSTIPSDLQNPANSIAGAPQSYPKRTTKKIELAPRIGVSFPIFRNSSVYFSYGHFYQMPPLSYIFSNSDYSILKELQAGGINYGVMGNPDLKPEFTAQYEFGFKSQLSDNFGLDLNLYYKDIRDLLGVEFVSTYTAAEYARFTNVDFGNAQGFTLALDYRFNKSLSLSLDYTYQMVTGNSSDPRETAIRAEMGEDPRPRLIFLNWDQRHTFNAVLIYQKPQSWSLSFIAKYGSGQPYTPTVGTTFGANLEANSARKSNYVLADLRFEKYFKMFGSNVSFFMRIYNLFSTRFVNGFVFTDTGSPDYSLNPARDAAMLLDPSRYYQPRRVEIGFTFKGSKKIK